MAATAEAEVEAAPRWQDELYDLLRANDVTQFSYVPDAGHRILIDRSLADPDAHSIALTTEEEGVALAAGADPADPRGQRHGLRAHARRADAAAEVQAQPRPVGVPRPFPRGAAVVTDRHEFARMIATAGMQGERR